MKNPSFSLPEFFCSKSMMRLCPRRGKNCRKKKNKIVWIFNKINDLNIRLNWVNATRMKCEYSLCPSTQHNAIENKYIRFYLLTFVVLIDVWYVHASVSTTTLVFVRDVFVVSCTTRNRVKFEGCGTGFPFLASRKKNRLLFGKSAWNAHKTAITVPPQKCTSSLHQIYLHVNSIAKYNNNNNFSRNFELTTPDGRTHNQFPRTMDIIY